MGGDEIVHLNEALIKHGHEQATSQLRREKWQRVRQQHTAGAVLCRNEQQKRGHRSSLGRRPSREAACLRRTSSCRSWLTAARGMKAARRASALLLARACARREFSFNRKIMNK